MGSKVSLANLPIVFSTLVVLLTIPLLLLAISKPTEFRKEAAQEYATLTLETQSVTIPINQTFKVTIGLDTGNRTIPTTGTDVILKYAPFFEPINIIPGTIYNTYPIKKIDPVTKTISISGAGSTYKSYFAGAGVFATIEFKAVGEGKVSLSFVWKGATATDDTNVVGLVNGIPQERLVAQPLSLNLTIISPSTPTPTITPKPSPTSIPCVSEGGTMPIYPGYQCCEGLKAISTAKPNENGICPSPPPIGASICAKCGNGICGLGENKCNCPQDCVSPPTPTPSPAAWLDFKLSLIGRVATPSGNQTRVLIFYSLPENPLGLFLLGATQTNTNGYGMLEIPSTLIGKTVNLYARTPSHLRKLGKLLSPPLYLGGNLLDFGELIPGDIFIAGGAKEQDNIINNFDVAEMFRQWVGGGAITPEGFSADLNGDRVVNTWDLKLLFENFGKTGDGPGILPSPRPTPWPTLLPSPVPTVTPWPTRAPLLPTP